MDEKKGRAASGGRRWLAAGLAAALPLSAAAAQTLQDLQGMSIEELGNVEISSVSKKPQPLGDAPAAAYVITADDIAESGAASIPEILRLAPNLQVAQMSADSYAITARGFNGNAADKLLVMIDGRSVYTPLFGGVLWDVQDVPPEDIERIEVISGPGATLWGANAVNGIINVITKDSGDRTGGVLEFGMGNLEERASLQYGGRLRPDLSYRVYLDGAVVRSGKTSTGANALDGWSKPQGGFRLDWTPPDDRVTLQGDLYRAAEEGTPTLDTDVSGGDVQLTWQHRLDDGSSLQLLAYYDEARRFVDDFGGYSLDSYDLEVQHDFSLGRHGIVWGAGWRTYRDRFGLVGSVQFLPASRTESLADIFAQDTISLTPALSLILGLKVEDDPYSGVAPLPNARISWKPDDRTLLWAAVSRAVRAPTRFDTDLQDTIIPSVLVLTGNPDFQSEKLTAYEVGARIRPTSAASVSVAAFYNVYDDLRSTEWLRMGSLPLLWTYGNRMEGDTYGIEVWGRYQVTDWWRLAAGFNLLHEALRFEPGSSALGGVATAGDDPHHQASLRSTVRLGGGVSWSAGLRYVGRLPDPAIPSYVELDTRLGWKISDAWEVSVSGFNLLHAHHLEYEEAGATEGDEVGRSVFVDTRWRF